MHEGNELGIPTMGPLAAEFQATLQGMPGLPGVGAFVTPAQRDALKDRLPSYALDFFGSLRALGRCQAGP